MGFYKLVAGKSYGADKSKEPDERGRYPTKKFVAGDVVESEANLEELHGSNKFVAVDGPKGARSKSSTAGKLNLGNALELARGGSGQVVSGMAEATTDEEGHPAQGYVEAEGEQLPAAIAGGVKGRSAPGGETFARDADYLKSNYGPLEDMTLQDMKDVCAEEEIDTHGARTKDDYKAKIQAHFGAE